MKRLLFTMILLLSFGAVFSQTIYRHSTEVKVDVVNEFAGPVTGTTRLMMHDPAADGLIKYITWANLIPAETDPVFGASEAANFAAGDKSKLDGIEPLAKDDQNAIDVPVSHSPVNYTPANPDVERHIEAIDARIGTLIPGAGVASVSSGQGISVDNTDPLNPIVNLGPVTANTSIPVSTGNELTIGDDGNNLSTIIIGDLMKVKTPNVQAATATNGQVLALSNAATGEVEFISTAAANAILKDQANTLTATTTAQDANNGGWSLNPTTNLFELFGGASATQSKIRMHIDEMLFQIRGNNYLGISQSNNVAVYQDFVPNATGTINLGNGTFRFATLNVNIADISNYIQMNPLGSAPAGVTGRIYYDNTAKKLFQYNGTAWEEVGSGGTGGIGSADQTVDGVVRTWDMINGGYTRILDGTTEVARLGNNNDDAIYAEGVEPVPGGDGFMDMVGKWRLYPLDVGSTTASSWGNGTIVRSSPGDQLYFSNGSRWATFVEVLGSSPEGTIKIGVGPLASKPGTLNAGELYFPTDATRMTVIPTATWNANNGAVTMDGLMGVDERTVDEPTFTFSSFTAGDEINIYINRATAPTLAGTGLTFNELPSSDNFSASTEQVLSLFATAIPNVIDYVYKNR